MRKALSLLFVLLLSCSLAAQIRTGNIYGKITDEDGNPLPGVTVTLTGARTAPLTSITSAEGIYRFLSLPPARDYVIRAELAGFKTAERTGIIVVVGHNVELNLMMEIGRIEEEVTVTAVSPVVDMKKTAIGANVTQEVLQSLPTARDPWVILQMAPSIIVDRENVGGVESGQQSTYVARGAGNYNNNVWAMDGIVITDPSAIGASPSYYDFDAFEEMNITVGGADVTVQTGGVALNMVTRRGGNKVSFGGRFYMIDEKFQAKNENFVEDTQVDEPSFLGLNLIRNNKDYGFNLGGPLVKDKAWLWGSYGVQDIKTTTVYQRSDDTLLQNYAAKLNIQIIPENRFEAFMHVGGKNKWGRSSSASNPDGLYQGGRYHFGSPIFKFQDEHMFGDNLFISLKYAFSDAGFNLTPMMDRDFENLTVYDYTDQRFYGSVPRYYVERPVNQYNFLLNYFNDSLLGASHDIKVGFEYADRNAYTESVYSGNVRVFQNYNFGTYDIDADGLPDLVPGIKLFEYRRGFFRDYGVGAYAAYFSDTITIGRFNILLGVRYDYQRPRVNPVTIAAVNDSPVWTNTVSSAAQTALDTIMPGIDISEIQATADNGSTYAWRVWSPRLGLTWDVNGDGKTIAKLSLSAYGDFMGVGSAGSWMPGGASGLISFWWLDDTGLGGNGDGIVDVSELYWHTIADYAAYSCFDGSGSFIGDWDDAAGVFWSGFDPDDPLALQNPYTTLEKNAGSTRTLEAMLTLEKEIFADFAVTLNATYRKYDMFTWSNKYFIDANGNRYGFVSQDWYESAGQVPSQLNLVDSDGNPVDTRWDGNTGEAANHDWYYMTNDYTEEGTSFDPSAYSPWSLVTRQPDYYRDFYGIDLIFNKRLSNRWMLTGSLTWQHQAQHFGDEGYRNPTNIWALDGEPYAPFIGGASGKINQYTYSRWLVKVGGLYQLPYDFNVSFTFLAREGWVINETFTYVNYTLPNPRSRSDGLQVSPFGSDRLNTFYRFDMRLEKMVKLGDTGRIYLMADLFNVVNAKLENRRYQKSWGTYYFYGTGDSRNYFRPDVTAYTLNEILNPRVLRLGVRFQF